MLKFLFVSQRIPGTMCSLIVEQRTCGTRTRTSYVYYITWWFGWSGGVSRVCNHSKATPTLNFLCRPGIRWDCGIGAIQSSYVCLRPSELARCVAESTLETMSDSDNIVSKAAIGGTFAYHAGDFSVSALAAATSHCIHHPLYTLKSQMMYYGSDFRFKNFFKRSFKEPIGFLYRGTL